jgi:hypothetical protein
MTSSSLPGCLTVWSRCCVTVTTLQAPQRRWHRLDLGGQPLQHWAAAAVAAAAARAWCFLGQHHTKISLHLTGL